MLVQSLIAIFLLIISFLFFLLNNVINFRIVIVIIMNKNIIEISHM